METMEKVVYLDNAATTACAPEVLAVMTQALSGACGNPSSHYSVGYEAKEFVDTGRAQVAKAINASPAEIFFTGCGSEADNWAVKGTAFTKARQNKKHLITSAFEHHAIMHSMAALERMGFEVTYIKPTPEGYIRPEDVEAAIRPDTALVSIMMANNEIGTIQPIKEIAEIAHITEARIGNISSRPVFRDYVIDYLSNLDETLAERIPASDLILSVRKGRFYLRSKRFDKEVIPRLTCAHNYSLSPIPMYRFLADMQSLQRTQGFGFPVGSLFSTLDYMPRIRYKNIVLSRRRWKLNYDDVKSFSAYRTEEHRKAFAGYVAERRLPRRIVHPMGDNELLLDLHDDRCVRLLFSLLRKYKMVSVEEFLFDTEHAVVHDEQANGYTNEMIVILHK